MPKFFSRLSDWLLFLIPLSVILGSDVRLQVGPLPIYPVELVAVAAIIARWREEKPDWHRLRTLPRSLYVGLALVMPGLLVSVYVAKDRHEALGALKSWFVLPLIFMGLLYALKAPRRPLLYGIIALGLLETVIGQYLMPFQTEHRLVGTFSSPNFYAALAAPILMLALTELKGWARTLSVIYLLLGLVLSQSIGGFLGLGIGLIGLILLAPPSKLRQVGIIGLILVAIVGGAMGRDRFRHIAGTSFASRIEIWRTAKVIIEEHPVAGIGLRGFKDVYEGTVGRVIGAPIEWLAPEPHDLYLSWWVNLGLLGLLGMLLITGTTLLRGGRQAVVVPAKLALIVVLGHGLVDTPFFKLELVYLFWIYCLLVFLAAKLEA